MCVVLPVTSLQRFNKISKNFFQNKQNKFSGLTSVIIQTEAPLQNKIS